MTEIRKNQRLIICPACQKKIVCDNETNIALVCEGCKNELFIDENSEIVVIGNIEVSEVTPNDSDIDSKEDEKPTDDKELSSDKEINPFVVSQE